MINITPEKMTEPTSDDSEVVLSVQGVSKKFCRDLKRSLLYGVQDIASDLTGIRQKSDRLRNREFWALDNVSFQLKKGEALGLIGKNGSGKSTLLRIIAGLIKPDLGTIKVTGRVAPLIALGAGFNPILTGRENIYANMSILGLSTKEIDERFDDVVEFAEIGDAVDAPVQTYSSGMAARLGFASAIHTEPDILLIDEVLVVGDIRFRGKCSHKLAELREKGTSFIMVSHNSDSLSTICDRGFYLLKGCPVTSGDIKSVLARYEQDLFVRDSLNNLQDNEPYTFENKNSDVSIKFFSIKSIDSESEREIYSGKPAIISVLLNSKYSYDNIDIVISISSVSKEGGVVADLRSADRNFVIDIEPGNCLIKIHIPHCILPTGSYTANISVRHGLRAIDRIDSLEFSVLKSSDLGPSKFYQHSVWQAKAYE